MMKKKTAKKPIKKATKPVPKKTAKAPSQKKAFKRADAKSPKKSGGNKAKKKVVPTIPVKIRRAEDLRIKSNKDFSYYAKQVDEWPKKAALAKNREEERRIDEIYEAKIKRLEEKSDKSYSAYYNHVDKNFTKEQRNAALKYSGDFMSKKYTNGLLKAVRDEKKR